ncbi:MAG: non-canonical purine NTP pyrophosphatase [Candidatus Kerfeldbacteria bacterium]
MLDTIVIATQNPAKKARYGRILKTLAKNVVNLKDLGVAEKPTESGETAEQNAEIKARFYADRVKFPVLAEDEALFLDYLSVNEQPGVHVRRVNGREEVNDDELLAHWEGIVSKLPEGKRTGKWHIAYCLAVQGKPVATVALDHPILFFSPPSKVRIPGWPMSSLEGPVRFGKPHTELTEEEHRMNDATADEAIRGKLGELMRSKYSN